MKIKLLGWFFFWSLISFISGVGIIQNSIYYDLLKTCCVLSFSISVLIGIAIITNFIEKHVL